MSTALQIQDRRDHAFAIRQSLEPLNLAEAIELSERLAKSMVIPPEYRGKPADVLVTIMFGREVGLPPIQSLESIATINGRRSVWGDAALAIVINSPDYESHEEHLEGTGDERVGVHTIKRKGHKPHTIRFSVKDARVAKLWEKTGPWTNYPDRMLKLRARGFAIRDKFPDALKGLITREEAEDYTGGPTIEGDRTVSTSSPHSQGQTAAGSDTSQDQARDFSKVITQDDARDFGKAWKASGYTMEEAKAWLKANLNLESSLKIPASRYPDAMKWATTAKSTPAASAGDAAAAPTQIAEQRQEMSADEKNCREAFGLLDWNLAEQADACQRHNGNWAALLAELNKKLNERDGQ